MINQPNVSAPLNPEQSTPAPMIMPPTSKSITFMLIPISFVMYCALQGMMTWPGILSSALFALLAHHHWSNPTYDTLRQILTVVCAGLFTFDVVPGINALVLYRDAALSALSMPHTAHIPMGLPLVILTLLPNILMRDKPGIRSQQIDQQGLMIVKVYTPAYLTRLSLQFTFMTTVAAFIYAFSIRLVELDPKLPPFFPYVFGYVLCNVIAIECIFRGSVQALAPKNTKLIVGVLVAALSSALLSIDYTLQYWGYMAIIHVGAALAYASTTTIIAPIMVVTVPTLLHYFLLTYPLVV